MTGDRFCESLNRNICILAMYEENTVKLEMSSFCFGKKYMLIFQNVHPMSDRTCVELG